MALILSRLGACRTRFGIPIIAWSIRIFTDDWGGNDLENRGYKHFAVAERGDPQVVEEYLPNIHLAFSNLKTWLRGIHHGVSHQHLQAYLNEFTFRFIRRFYPFNASALCSA
jgi:hypothetical protein